MIRYPFLEEGATIGITAPSSGVKVELHDLLKLSCTRMEKRGFNIICGDTAWTQHKAKSSTAKLRAVELNDMMRDDTINIIIPPYAKKVTMQSNLYNPL